MRRRYLELKVTEIKQLDYKGRATIPPLFLRAAGIEPSTPIAISYLTDSKSIVITRLDDPDLVNAFTSKDSNI